MCACVGEYDCFLRLPSPRGYGISAGLSTPRESFILQSEPPEWESCLLPGLWEPPNALTHLCPSPNTSAHLPSVGVNLLQTLAPSVAAPHSSCAGTLPQPHRRACCQPTPENHQSEHVGPLLKTPGIKSQVLAAVERLHP